MRNDLTKAGRLHDLILDRSSSISPAAQATSQLPGFLGTPSRTVETKAIVPEAWALLRRTAHRSTISPSLDRSRVSGSSSRKGAKPAAEANSQVATRVRACEETNVLQAMVPPCIWQETVGRATLNCLRNADLSRNGIAVAREWITLSRNFTASLMSLPVGDSMNLTR